MKRELTNRENEVLTLITQGLIDKQIAHKLNISRRTVQTHVGRIFIKLNVGNKAQAAVYFLRNKKGDSPVMQENCCQTNCPNKKQCALYKSRARVRTLKQGYMMPNPDGIEYPSCFIKKATRAKK